MDEYFQDYSVRAQNARNSLPINGYPAKYTAERRGSRDERAKSPQRKEKARANDENGNTQRKLSTGEKIDLDFLRLIANRSAQASPSNVRIEEDGQKGVGSENGDNTLDVNVGVVDDKPLEKNDEGRSERSKKSDNVLITENADTNLIPPALVNGYNDVTLTDNDDSPARHDHSMRTVNDDFEKTNHELESKGKSSDVEEEEGLKGSELVQDAVDNINPDDDNKTNECFETKETDGQKGEEKEEEGEIVEKQEQQGLFKQEIGLLEEKEKEQQEEDEEHSGEMITPDKEQGFENEKQHQQDEQQEQQQQQETHQDEDQTLQDRDKEQIDKETSKNIHNKLNEPEELKILENGQDNLNTKNIDTEEVTSEIEAGPQQNDEGLASNDNV